MKKIYMTPEVEKEICGDVNPYSDEGIKKFKKWMSEHPEVYYYAEPKEEFSELVAVKKAQEAGCTTVLMENMS